MRPYMRRILALQITALLATPAAGEAQEAPRQPSPPPIAISGILVGSYQYLVGGPSRDFNQFTLDRAYLNVRAPAGDRMSIRLTTDVYRTTPDDQGWAIRAKYAYLQYELPRHRAFSANVRAGILQNVVIEHTDRIWFRPLSQSAIERHGAFASADAGIAKEMQLGDRLGEAYFTIVNGPGFGRREADRFKDFAGRLTLTPLGRRTDNPLSGLQLTGWTYRGAFASRFAAGGPDQVAPVTAALPRNRSGVQTAIRHPRITALVEHAWLETGSEGGANTAASPRTYSEIDGTISSAFVIARTPVRMGGRTPLGIVTRYDRVVPDRDRDDRYHFLISGLLYDLTTRATLSVNYQEQLPDRGLLPSGVANFRAWFLHAAVTY
jgi:hypothetical protein